MPKKLIYLKGYLTGESLSLIENVLVEDDSYAQAIKILDTNFLDKNAIINKILDSILNTPEVGLLKDVESFLRLISCKVHDLKG